jgi:hypothetical protein
MAVPATGEQKFSKAWIVLATILVLFFVALFVDRIIATVVPTYVGFGQFFLRSSTPIEQPSQR